MYYLLKDHLMRLLPNNFSIRENNNGKYPHLLVKGFNQNAYIQAVAIFDSLYDEIKGRVDFFAFGCFDKSHRNSTSVQFFTEGKYYQIISRSGDGGAEIFIGEVLYKDEVMKMIPLWENKYCRLTASEIETKRMVLWEKDQKTFHYEIMFLQSLLLSKQGTIATLVCGACGKTQEVVGNPLEHGMKDGLLGVGCNGITQSCPYCTNKKTDIIIFSAIEYHKNIDLPMIALSNRVAAWKKRFKKDIG